MVRQRNWRFISVKEKCGTCEDSAGLDRHLSAADQGAAVDEDASTAEPSNLVRLLAVSVLFTDVVSSRVFWF